MSYQRGYQKGRSDALDIIFYMTAYTIQYKMGFGKKRLQRTMHDIFNNIDAYRTGHLTPEDFDTIVNEIRTKYGIKLS